MHPVALTIAGSDSSGGAGIQADLKTFTLLGCYGATVLTAITAQNTDGVQAARLLDADLVERQIASVALDLRVAATKTGMLGSSAIIRSVAQAARRHELFPLVVDPVMIAKSGDALIDDDAVGTLVGELLPLATLVTPNRHEAARLVGHPVEDLAAAEAAARKVCDGFGARACVVKGIHVEKNAVDVLYDGKQVHHVERPWRGGKNHHGSGCTFSAAITAELAHGRSLPHAIDRAKTFIDAALASHVRLGHGTSPVDHFAGASAK